MNIVIRLLSAAGKVTAVFEDAMLVAGALASGGHDNIIDIPTYLQD